MIKLNLGCGKRLKEGYINADMNLDLRELGVRFIDAANLIEFKDNSVDEIYNSHLIEHFDFNKGLEVLKEWHRVLKPGGKLIIETPDLYFSCKYFVELYDKLFNNFNDIQFIRNEIFKLYGHFFSEPWKPYNVHYFLYSDIQLRESLGITGFKNIIRKRAENFVENCPFNTSIFLRIECEK